MGLGLCLARPKSGLPPPLLVCSNNSAAALAHVQYTLYEWLTRARTRLRWAAAACRVGTVWAEAGWALCSPGPPTPQTLTHPQSPPTRRDSGKGGRASALEVFMLSALAKAGATLVTYPMMNIKTRMWVT